MRRFILAVVLAVLHLSLVNSQWGDQFADSIGSNVPADSAFDTNNNNDGADDSKSVASNPNTDASYTDENTAVIAANPDDAVALCGTDNSQVDDKLDARDGSVCHLDRGPSPEASPPNGQSNGLSVIPGKIREFLKGNGWPTENPETPPELDPELGPVVRDRWQKVQCNLPPFKTGVCCLGPPNKMVFYDGAFVYDRIDNCEISTGICRDSIEACCVSFKNAYRVGYSPVEGSAYCCKIINVLGGS